MNQNRPAPTETEPKKEKAEIKEEKTPHATIKRQAAEELIYLGSGLVPFLDDYRNIPKPLLVALNDHLMLANTVKGLYLVNIHNIANPTSIDNVANKENIIEVIEVIPRSDKQFIRLCRAKDTPNQPKDQPIDSKSAEKNTYSLEIWNVKNDTKVECEKRIRLHDIPPYDPKTRIPTLLSLEPIRIVFEKPVSIDSPSKQQVMLTIRNDGQIANYFLCSIEIIHSIIPRQILSNNRYTALYIRSIAEKAALTIFNKNGQIEKRLDQFNNLEIFQESPDGQYWAIVNFRQLTVYKVTEQYDLIELENITNYHWSFPHHPQWLVDGNLIYLSNKGVELFNPHTLKNTTIFPGENINALSLTVMPLSANLLFFQRNELISLELTQLHKRLENIKSILNTTLSSPDIANLPLELAGITKSFLDTPKIIIENLNQKFEDPTKIPEELQAKIPAELQGKIRRQYTILEAEAFVLEKKHEEKKDQTSFESWVHKRDELTALKNLTASLNTLDEKPSKEEIEACINQVKESFNKNKPKSILNLFQNKNIVNNPLNKFFDEISQCNPADQNTTSPTKSR